MRDGKPSWAEGRGRRDAAVRNDGPAREGVPPTTDGSPGGLPLPGEWPGLPADEKAYREAKLHEIEHALERDGVHRARAHASRARQFMPFAALKGYHELAHAQEEADD